MKFKLCPLRCQTLIYWIVTSRMHIALRVVRAYKH